MRRVRWQNAQHNRGRQVANRRRHVHNDDRRAGFKGPHCSALVCRAVTIYADGPRSRTDDHRSDQRVGASIPSGQVLVGATVTLRNEGTGTRA